MKDVNTTNIDSIENLMKSTKTWIVVRLNKSQFDSLCFLTNNNPQNNTKVLCKNDSLIKTFLGNDLEIDYIMFIKEQTQNNNKCTMCYNGFIG